MIEEYFTCIKFVLILKFIQIKTEFEAERDEFPPPTLF